MIFAPLPRLVFPTARPLFGAHKGAVNETFGQVELAALFQVVCQRGKNLL